jgi:hypothetical protein
MPILKILIHCFIQININSNKNIMNQIWIPTNIRYKNKIIMKKIIVNSLKNIIILKKE